MKKSATADGEDSPARLIDATIEELDDWRGKTLARVRALIKQADPEVVEEWKWRKASSPGVPVWSHDGGICTGETYKGVVKLTFFMGASLSTLQDCSTPASKATPGALSISMRVMR